MAVDAEKPFPFAFAGDVAEEDVMGFGEAAVARANVETDTEEVAGGFAGDAWVGVLKREGGCGECDAVVVGVSVGVGGLDEWGDFCVEGGEGESPGGGLSAEVGLEGGGGEEAGREEGFAPFEGANYFLLAVALCDWDGWETYVRDEWRRCQSRVPPRVGPELGSPCCLWVGKMTLKLKMKLFLLFAIDCLLTHVTR